MERNSEYRENIYFISAVFLLARIILILSLPLEGLKSYGDFWNFYHLAALGQPFRDIWVEFPPLFPFISRGLYLLVGGKEHGYIYLSVILYSIVQAGGLFIFQRIAEIIWGVEKGFQAAVIYGFMILGLFYGWAYFDSLAVFLCLLSLFFLIKSRQYFAGLAIGFGGLVKWFPVLVLPAAWKWLGWKKGVRVVLSALITVVVIWGVLYILSPDMTGASLISQGAKGSWESIWALLDGNLRTGNFPPGADRTIPETAILSSGNPPLISPWITLLAFGGLGLFLFLKAEVRTERQLVAFSGLTLSLFYLWSPGYSPQWVLYLLPLILLSLEGSRGLLMAVIALLVNLLEWPLILTRGLFQFLPFTIILRSSIYILLAVLLAGMVLPRKKAQETE